MKRLLLFSLLVFGLMLTGCQSTSYRWFRTGAELPVEHVKTFTYKDEVITYCLVQDTPEGAYHFEGTAKNNGRHAKGQILNASYHLLLYKDQALVGDIRLNSQGRYMDKPIYLNRDFLLDEAFDCVSFRWNVRYKY